jgi:hypothetical protein
MGVYIAVAAVILIMILVAANSSSSKEKIDKSIMEERNKNEAKCIQVINGEPNEKARNFLKSAKEMFDNGDSLGTTDFLVKLGIPREIASSKNSNLITNYLSFEDEQARDLFNAYFIGIGRRYDLQSHKLYAIEDAFEKHKVVLNKGEVLYECFSGIYCLQEKTIQKSVSYSGVRYSSGSFRAGHLSYSTNDIKSFVVEDYGNLFLTNKRVLFVGKQKNFTLNMTIGNILDYYLYKDGILLCRSNMKNVIFKEMPCQQTTDGFTFLHDFSIQFISIIGRIANKTENQDIESNTNTIAQGEVSELNANNDKVFSETGYYVVSDKKLIPLNELPGKGSNNAIAESLGYPDYHSALAHNSEKVSSIAFKKHTKEPIFVELRDKTEPFSYLDLVKEINLIDWDFENRHIL